jgi:hypothetical protein
VAQHGRVEQPQASPQTVSPKPKEHLWDRHEQPRRETGPRCRGRQTTRKTNGKRWRTHLRDVLLKAPAVHNVRHAARLVARKPLVVVAGQHPGLGDRIPQARKDRVRVAHDLDVQTGRHRPSMSGMHRQTGPAGVPRPWACSVWHGWTDRQTDPAGVPRPWACSMWHGWTDKQTDRPRRHAKTVGMQRVAWVDRWTDGHAVDRWKNCRHWPQDPPSFRGIGNSLGRWRRQKHGWD